MFKKFIYFLFIVLLFVQALNIQVESDSEVFLQTDSASSSATEVQSKEDDQDFSFIKTNEGGKDKDEGDEGNSSVPEKTEGDGGYSFGPATDNSDGDDEGGDKEEGYGSIGPDPNATPAECSLDNPFGVYATEEGDVVKKGLQPCPHDLFDLPKRYKLSFTLNYKKYKGGWLSIFRITDKNQVNSNGCNGCRLHDVRQAGHGIYWYIQSTNNHNWYLSKVFQMKVGETYNFEVRIDTTQDYIGYFVNDEKQFENKRYKYVEPGKKNVTFFASNKFDNFSEVNLSNVELADWAYDPNEPECGGENGGFGVFATSEGDIVEKDRLPCPGTTIEIPQRYEFSFTVEFSRSYHGGWNNWFRLQNKDSAKILSNNQRQHDNVIKVWSHAHAVYITIDKKNNRNFQIGPFNIKIQKDQKYDFQIRVDGKAKYLEVLINGEQKYGDGFEQHQWEETRKDLVFWAADKYYTASPLTLSNVEVSDWSVEKDIYDNCKSPFGGFAKDEGLSPTYRLQMCPNGLKDKQGKTIADSSKGLNLNGRYKIKYDLDYQSKLHSWRVLLGIVPKNNRFTRLWLNENNGYIYFWVYNNVGGQQSHYGPKVIPGKKYSCVFTLDDEESIFSNECTDIATGKKEVAEKAFSGTVERQTDCKVHLGEGGQRGGGIKLSNVQLENLTPIDEKCVHPFGRAGFEEGMRPKRGKQICPDGITIKDEEGDDKVVPNVVDLNGMYTLQYDLKVTTVNGNWQSALRLTNGNNNASTKKDRALNVLYHGGNRHLYVCVTTQGSNNLYTTGPALDKGKEYSCTFTAHKNASFISNICREKGSNKSTTRAQIAANGILPHKELKVYVSDKFHEPFKGIVSNVEINELDDGCDNPFGIYGKSEYHSAYKNHQVCSQGIEVDGKTVPNLLDLNGRYTVYYEFQQGKFINTWTNIFRLTKGNGNAGTGDRVLTVFLHGHPNYRKLHTNIIVYGNNNWTIDSPYKIEENHEYKCKITVDFHSNKFEHICKDLTTNKDLPKFEKNSPAITPFGDVKVYVSDRHHTAANVKLRNMKWEPLAELDSKCDNPFGRAGHKVGDRPIQNKIQCEDGITLQKISTEEGAKNPTIMTSNPDNKKAGAKVPNLLDLNGMYEFWYNIKIDRNVSGWSSVIRLTKGTTNHSNRNDRILAFFLHSNLHIYIAVTTKTSNNLYTTGPRIQLNKEYRCRFTVNAERKLLRNECWEYKDETLGKKLAVAQVSAPGILAHDQTKVFISDSFYPASITQLRNFSINPLPNDCDNPFGAAGKDKGFLIEKAFEVCPNGLQLPDGTKTKTNLVDLNGRYELYYNFEFLNNVHGWSSLLRVTKGTGNAGNKNDRALAIFLHSNKKIYIAITAYGNNNYYKNTSFTLTEKHKYECKLIIDSNQDLFHHKCRDVTDDKNLPEFKFTDVVGIYGHSQCKVYTGDIFHNPSGVRLYNTRIELLTPLKEMCDNHFGRAGHKVGDRPSSDNKVCEDGIRLPKPNGKPGKLIPNKVTLPHRYQLTYDVKIRKNTGGWASLIRLTKDYSHQWKNRNSYPLGVMYNGNRYLYPSINLNNSHWFYVTGPQIQIGKDYTCRFTVDSEIKQLTNECTEKETGKVLSARRATGNGQFYDEHKDLDVYLGDKFYQPALANLSNIDIKPLKDACDNPFGKAGHEEGWSPIRNVQICPKGITVNGKKQPNKVDLGKNYKLEYSFHFKQNIGGHHEILRLASTKSNASHITDRPISIYMFSTYLDIYFTSQGNKGGGNNLRSSGFIQGHKYECIFRHYGDTRLATNECRDLTQDKYNNAPKESNIAAAYQLVAGESADHQDLDVYSCSNHYNPAGVNLFNTKLSPLDDDDTCGENDAFGPYGQNELTSIYRNNLPCPDSSVDVPQGAQITFKFKYSNKNSGTRVAFSLADQTSALNAKNIQFQLSNSTPQFYILLGNRLQLISINEQLKVGETYDFQLRFDGSKNYVDVSINGKQKYQNKKTANNKAFDNQRFAASPTGQHALSSELGFVKISPFSHDRNEPECKENVAFGIFATEEGDDVVRDRIPCPDYSFKLKPQYELTFNIDIRKTTGGWYNLFRITKKGNTGNIGQYDRLISPYLLNNHIYFVVHTKNNRNYHLHFPITKGKHTFQLRIDGQNNFRQLLLDGIPAKYNHANAAQLLTETLDVQFQGSDRHYAAALMNLNSLEIKDWSVDQLNSCDNAFGIAGNTGLQPVQALQICKDGYQKKGNNKKLNLNGRFKLHYDVDYKVKNGGGWSSIIAVTKGSINGANILINENNATLRAYVSTKKNNGLFLDGPKLKVGSKYNCILTVDSEEGLLTNTCTSDSGDEVTADKEIDQAKDIQEAEVFLCHKSYKCLYGTVSGVKVENLKPIDQRCDNHFGRAGHPEGYRGRQNTQICADGITIKNDKDEDEKVPNLIDNKEGNFLFEYDLELNRKVANKVYSIIRLTSGTGNNTNKNDRAVFIWYNGGNRNIYACVTTKQDQRNGSCVNTPNIQQNERYHCIFEVNRGKRFTQNTCTILDGSNKDKQSQSTPRQNLDVLPHKNLKVFIGDKYYPSFPGQISNVELSPIDEQCDNPFGIYGKNKWQAPVRYHHICSQGITVNGEEKPNVLQLKGRFTLYYEFKPTANNSNSNLFRLTKGKGNAGSNDRCLAVFTHGNTNKLRAAITTRGNNNFVVDFTWKYELNHKYGCTIEVDSSENLFKHSCKDLTDDKDLPEAKKVAANIIPHEDVKIYISDNHYHQFKGELRNFKFEEKEPLDPKCDNPFGRAGHTVGLRPSKNTRICEDGVTLQKESEDINNPEITRVISNPDNKKAGEKVPNLIDLPDRYVLHYDVDYEARIHGWSNLLRVTKTNVNCSTANDRIIAIFMHSNDHLYPAITTGSSVNRYPTGPRLTVGRKYKCTLTVDADRNIIENECTDKSNNKKLPLAKVADNKIQPREDAFIQISDNHYNAFGGKLSSLRITPIPNFCDNPFGQFGHQESQLYKNYKVCAKGYTQDGQDGPQKLDLPEKYKLEFDITPEIDNQNGGVISTNKGNKKPIKVDLQRGKVAVYTYPSSGYTYGPKLVKSNKYHCVVTVDTHNDKVKIKCKNLTDSSKELDETSRSCKNISPHNDVDVYASIGNPFKGLLGNVKIKPVSFCDNAFGKYGSTKGHVVKKNHLVCGSGFVGGESGKPGKNGKLDIPANYKLEFDVDVDQLPVGKANIIALKGTKNIPIRVDLQNDGNLSTLVHPADKSVEGPKLQKNNKYHCIVQVDSVNSKITVTCVIQKNNKALTPSEGKCKGVKPQKNISVYVSLGDKPAKCDLANVKITPFTPKKNYCTRGNAFGVFGSSKGGKPTNNGQVCEEGTDGINNKKGTDPTKIDLYEGYKVKFVIDYQKKQSKETGILGFKKGNKFLLRIGIRPDNSVIVYPAQDSNSVVVSQIKPSNKYQCVVTVNTRDNEISGNCKNLTNDKDQPKATTTSKVSKCDSENDIDVYVSYGKATNNVISFLKIQEVELEDEHKDCKGGNALGVYGTSGGSRIQANYKVCPNGITGIPNSIGEPQSKPSKISLPRSWRLKFIINVISLPNKQANIIASRKGSGTPFKIDLKPNGGLAVYINNNLAVDGTKLAAKNKYRCIITADYVSKKITSSCVNLTTNDKKLNQADKSPVQGISAKPDIDIYIAFGKRPAECDLSSVSLSAKEEDKKDEGTESVAIDKDEDSDSEKEVESVKFKENNDVCDSLFGKASTQQGQKCSKGRQVCGGGYKENKDRKSGEIPTPDTLDLDGNFRFEYTIHLQYNVSTTTSVIRITRGDDNNSSVNDRALAIFITKNNQLLVTVSTSDNKSNKTSGPNIKVGKYNCVFTMNGRAGTTTNVCTEDSTNKQLPVAKGRVNPNKLILHKNCKVFISDKFYNAAPCRLSNARFYRLSDCITVYSQCNYKGDSMIVCDNIPVFRNVDWHHEVKSIDIPDNFTRKVHVFEYDYYKGKKYTTTQDKTCLKDHEYTFLKANKMSAFSGINSIMFE